MLKLGCRVNQRSDGLISARDSEKLIDSTDDGAIVTTAADLELDDLAELDDGFAERLTSACCARGGSTGSGRTPDGGLRAGSAVHSGSIQSWRFQF